MTYFLKESGITSVRLKPGLSCDHDARQTRLATTAASEVILWCDLASGSNSVVESRLPKPLVAGSIPVSRSSFWHRLFLRQTYCP